MSALDTMDHPELLERLGMLWEALCDDDKDRDDIAYDLAVLLDEIDPQPFWTRAAMFGRRPFDEPTKCDGDHGMPECSSPECWQKDPPEYLRQLTEEAGA